jgi:hypothetical protein
LASLFKAGAHAVGEGREQHNEIFHRRFIFPPDLQEDQAYMLDNYNWDTFGLWEFDPRRRAGYLGDVAYLNAILDHGLINNNDNEDEDAEEAEEEVPFGNNGVDGVQPELRKVQPPKMTEKEDIELVMALSELNVLG